MDIKNREDNNIIIFLIFDIGSFDIKPPINICLVNLIIINDNMRNFKLYLREISVDF